jgi:hypothetical protein
MLTVSLSARKVRNSNLFLDHDHRRRIPKMTNDTTEAAKADAKKGIADAGKAGAYVKADAEADVEKVKASFGKSDLEKKVAYATADIKADAKKANAEVENKMAHAKADLERAKAGQKK